MALASLLERIRPEVLRRCSRVLPFHGDAEDATQDALLAVTRGISGFQGRSKFTTWLYPLVARCSFATYRRLRDQAVPAEPSGPVIDPRRVSVLAGARVDVVEALTRLREDRPHLVEAVVLRDLMGMEYAEVADRLDVPLGTVKSRINHGRAALRELLGARA